MERRFPVGLTFFSLEHTPNNIRGFLCRYMYEMRPGVYAGSISTTQRNTITDYLQKNVTGLDLVVAYEKCGQLTFEQYGDPTRYVTDFDGCQLLTRIANESPKDYDLILAKSDGTTLLQHMQNTGRICRYLLTETTFIATLDQLVKATNMDEDVLLNSICFIVALHDIGKAHPVFQQNMHTETLNDLIEKGYIDSKYLADHMSFRHEHQSGRIFEDIADKYEDDDASYDISRVIESHHQNKSQANETVYDYWAGGDKEKWHTEIIEPLIEEIRKEFPYTPINCNGHTDLVCRLISGILLMSDWLASSGLQEGYPELNTIRKFDDVDIPWNTLFPEFVTEGYTLRPVQKLVKYAVKMHPNFSMMMIEASAGSGKTKPGIYAACKAMLAHKKQGMYFALPTDATSLAIIGEITSAISNTGYPVEEVTLATGSAKWHPELADHSELYSIIREKLLNIVSVGTVDQIMSCACRIRYGDLKLAILSTKVLVVDEMHAYDAYMMRILVQLLKICKEFDVPVIIMSATMSDELKTKICKIYDSKFTRNDLMPPYPMVTLFDDGQIVQMASETPEPSKSYKVILQNTLNNQRKIAELAVELTERGGNTAVIMNTVNQANEVMRELNEICSEDDGIILTLLTARTTPEWRAEKTERVIGMYGKKGKKDGRRPLRSIIVSTQILEQSMDIDVDFMITAIAPIDLLLQRFGRYRRHDDRGTIRENNPDISNEIYVLYDPALKNTLPYNNGVIKSTLDVLKNNPSITVPLQTRNVINRTYDNAGELWAEEESAKLTRAAIRALPDLSPDEYSHDLSDEYTKLAATRLQQYETVDLLFVPEGVNMSDISYDEARNLIYERSVSVPKKQLEKAESIYDKLPVEAGLLQGYTIVSEAEARMYGLSLDAEYGFICNQNHI